MREYIRKTIIFTIAILIFSSVTVAPAAAFWPFNGDSHQDKLDEIDDQVEDLQNKTNLMRFINQNMWEQEVNFIKVEIKGGKEKNIYYFVRNESSYNAESVATIVHEEPSGGNMWVFYPNIKQAFDGLEILDSNTLSINSVLKAIWLYLRVKSSGLPSLTDMIENSTWICGYIPDWSWWASSC